MSARCGPMSTAQQSLEHRRWHLGLTRPNKLPFARLPVILLECWMGRRRMSKRHAVAGTRWRCGAKRLLCPLQKRGKQHSLKGNVQGERGQESEAAPEVVHGGRLVLAGQATLVALAVARDVHRMALLQLRDLRLNSVPPAAGVYCQVLSISTGDAKCPLPRTSAKA